MEAIPAFFFDLTTLTEKAHRLRPTFLHAKPFPHVVIDDFLPVPVLQKLIQEFPGPEDPSARWESHGPGRTSRSPVPGGDKLATSDEETFPAFIRHFMGQLNSRTFVRFLEELTGVKGLIVDPGFGGCGLHSTGRGGRLMIHTDVNRHTVSNMRLHQILNVILYLNEDWKDEYGGHLEFWNSDRRREVSILPIANRFVVFATGTRTFHGHPGVLAPPSNRRRNSLAAYYYTIDRPFADDYSGFQRDVYWVATAPEDLQIERDLTTGLLERLREANGRQVSLPTALMPAELCERMGIDGASYVAAVIFDWDDIRDKDGFRSSNLGASMRENDSQREFITRLRPFATTELDGVPATHRRHLTLMVDPLEGKIYAATNDFPDVFWLGYGDLIPPVT